MLGSGGTAIMGYSTVPTDNSSPINTLTFPSSYYGGPLATDSSGQIYVAVAINPVDPLNLGDIFIYSPNSTGTASPSRTIDVSSYDVVALAVDPAGLLYVAIQESADATPTVSVYSTTARGTATPLRTLQLTNVQHVNDIAVDGAGNLYVAGDMSTECVIAVYPPIATGPATPARTINFGTSIVYGVAVDPVGDVFANVCLGCNLTSFAIEEFAPEANGAATPINTINLTVGLLWQNVQGGPVRLDGAGSIFTSFLLFPNPGEEQTISIVVYGFGPTATGSTAPSVQITPTDGYTTFFAVN
jgi:hypothetical protein